MHEIISYSNWRNRWQEEQDYGSASFCEERRGCIHWFITIGMANHVALDESFSEITSDVPRYLVAVWRCEQ
jgi:hypothetical protein